MKGFTIQSTSDEGIYFLVNHWEKHKAFWVDAKNLKQEMLFSKPEYAKRSLKKLLTIMDDYRTDKFETVEIYTLNTGCAIMDMNVTNHLEGLKWEGDKLCEYVL